MSSGTRGVPPMEYGRTVPVVFRVTYSPASKIAWSVVHV